MPGTTLRPSGSVVAAPRVARRMNSRLCRWVSSPSSPRGYAGHHTSPFRLLRGCATRSPKGEAWWSQAGSNRRPLACHASALPAELWPLDLTSAPWAARWLQYPEHSSGSISSLFVAADVADNIGDVLVAFFLIGDEGRIIVIIAFDGLVDLDIVFGFGNDGLDLAGLLLGIGFLKRHQLFGFCGLRHFRDRGCCGGARGVAAGGTGWRDRCDRHDLAGVGRDHRTLVQVVELLTRRRANAFGSEIGFGHVLILGIF